MENSLESYEKLGFVVIPSLVTQAELEPLQAVLEKVVQQRTDQLYRKGLIEDACADATFKERWHRIVQQYPAKAGHGIWNERVFGREIYDLTVHSTILDELEELIGPEITVNGDYWVRPMLPQDQVTPTPWHQDSGYYEDHPSGRSDILTVWIPLVDVDANNGCLEVIPSSHEWGLVDTYLPEGKQWREPILDPVEKGVPQPVPMKRGDALVFSNLLFHRSLPNRSNLIRWSVDFRYSRTSLPLPLLNQKYPGFIARSKCHPDSVETFTVWRDRVMGIRRLEVINN